MKWMKKKKQQNYEWFGLKIMQSKFKVKKTQQNEMHHTIKNIEKKKCLTDERNTTS